MALGRARPQIASSGKEEAKMWIQTFAVFGVMCLMFSGALLAGGRPRRAAVPGARYGELP